MLRRFLIPARFPPHSFLRFYIHTHTHTQHSRYTITRYFAVPMLTVHHDKGKYVNVKRIRSQQTATFATFSKLVQMMKFEQEKPANYRSTYPEFYLNTVWRDAISRINGSNDRSSENLQSKFSIAFVTHFEYCNILVHNKRYSITFIISLKLFESTWKERFC